MWNIYMSRVLQPGDLRLKDPCLPFFNNEIHFIVHRHRIRTMRSMDHAKEYSKVHKAPLYSVQARDEVVRVDGAAKLTPQLRASLLQRVNPDDTSGLPGFLPLYRGMRLLLSPKDCVRLGIVKGCPCILETIVFADDENLPYEHVAGQPHHLRYMPLSLLLRAEAAAWSLAKDDLPKNLPASMDTRGLFQMRPTYGYLRASVENEYVTIRRTTFMATPADTITVYAAQGSTFDAVVADMQRPPHLVLAKHWLVCYVMLSQAKSLEGFWCCAQRHERSFLRGRRNICWTNWIVCCG